MRYKFKRLWYFITYPLWEAFCRCQVTPWCIKKRALGWTCLGRALWYPGQSSPEYLWKHFGEPLTEIPSAVLIGAIGYTVQVHEGLIVFTQDSGFYGIHARISFERVEGSLWYLQFDQTFGRVPMCHVLKAFRYVEAVYGGDWDVKKSV